MKAALAIDSIAECNYESQKKAAFEGAPDALCRLFQVQWIRFDFGKILYQLVRISFNNTIELALAFTSC